jgi:hypothetical protein
VERKVPLSVIRLANRVAELECALAFAAEDAAAKDERIAELEKNQKASKKPKD